MRSAAVSPSRAWTEVPQALATQITQWFIVSLARDSTYSSTEIRPAPAGSALRGREAVGPVLVVADPLRRVAARLAQQGLAGTPRIRRIDQHRSRTRRRGRRSDHRRSGRVTSLALATVDTQHDDPVPWPRVGAHTVTRGAPDPRPGAGATPPPLHLQAAVPTPRAFSLPMRCSWTTTT